MDGNIYTAIVNLASVSTSLHLVSQEWTRNRARILGLNQYSAIRPDCAEIGQLDQLVLGCCLCALVDTALFRSCYNTLRDDICGNRSEVA